MSVVCVYKLLFSEKQATLKLSVAELSYEIAKSLAKKLDRKEFKAIAATKKVVYHIEYITCIMYPISEDESNREEKKGIETEQCDSSSKKKQNNDFGQPTPLRNSIDTSNIRQPDFSIMENKNNHIRTSNGNLLPIS